MQVIVAGYPVSDSVIENRCLRFLSSTSIRFDRAINNFHKHRGE